MAGGRIDEEIYHIPIDINSDLAITYIGDEEKFSKLKKIEISYKSPGSGGTIKEEYGSEVKSKSFTFNNTAGGAILDKDTIITVTINMDGEIQTLELVDE